MALGENNWEKYKYLLKYMDMEYHAQYDPERSKMHASIVDTYFTNKTKTIKKKIIIVCGCYGSGKNYMVNLLQKDLLNANEYVHVDLDEVRQQIPEYLSYVKENPWTAIYKTNRESGYIVELIQKHALFNGSLKDSKWHYLYLNWIKETFPAYNAIVFYIKTTWEKILERNLLRAEEQGRWIPLKILKESMECSELSFERIKLHPIVRDYGQIYNAIQNFNPIKENSELITRLLQLLTL